MHPQMNEKCIVNPFRLSEQMEEDSKPKQGKRFQRRHVLSKIKYERNIH